MPKDKRDNFFKTVSIIVILGIFVFFNGLFNDFIADDKSYIISNSEVHTINLPLSFGPNLFNMVGQYRPLQPTYFSILYALFGTSPFPYHILQVLLHITATTLLYVLFRKFLSYGMALFASLVFLVHPVQVESVSYIGQTASPLFFLLGIIPLLLIVRKNLSGKMYFVAFALLLLSILMKETGVLFLFLFLVYSFLFYRRNLVKLSIGSVITLAIYAYFRFAVGHVGFETRPLSPIAHLSLSERLSTIPAIMFYYLKTFFYPSRLSFDQQWTVTSINLSSFYIPLFLDVLFFILIVLIALSLKRLRYFHSNNLKMFLFFSAWFVLGLFFHLNIFPIEATVADRWFYFPMVGFIGLICLTYQILGKRILVYNSRLITIFSILIILSLSAGTILRNRDWRNGITLYSHDARIEDNFNIENNLATEYLLIRNYKEALKHYKKSVELFPYDTNLCNLGLTYYMIGNYNKAKEYCYQGLHTNPYLYGSHKYNLQNYEKLAGLLIVHGESKPAKKLIKNIALKDYPNVGTLWMLLAYSEYALHHHDEAIYAAKKAMTLSPGKNSDLLYKQILTNQPLKQLQLTFSP